jgi:glycosyltransferase involved in cell wall biosynthesis
LDIFVGSSVHESFGVAILEAMSCGLPVIANNIDAYREIDGGSHVLQFVDITNSHAVADLMYKLANDAALRLHLGRQSREIIRAKFDFKDNFRLIENQYQICLNESSHHSRGQTPVH